MFKYLLKLPDGEPPDPAVLVTRPFRTGASATWSRSAAAGSCAWSRLDCFPHTELVEQDVRAIFTVEPV